MTSQNRMNAGAEYLLYRIWATLQTERGIHAESLLTCVGALAGYACQHYVRATWPLSRPDDLNAQLVESPLSLWALVSRSVLKLEEPLPDLQQILLRASPSGGVDLAQVPSLPGWHRPHRTAIVYLKQLWPQTLPIAQRFCRRPLQMPVLFGIALQRAIEHTKDLLSPTLAASIAMECAVAMARVEVPEWEAARAPASSLDALTDPARGSITGVSSNLPLNAAAPIAPAAGRPAKPAPAAMPRLAAISSAVALPAIRATSQRRTKPAAQRDSDTPRLWALIKRIPPAAHVATIGCLAFISTAGAMYNPTREEPIVLAALQTSAPAPGFDTMAAVATGMSAAAGQPADALESTSEELSDAEVTADSQPASADTEQTPEPPPPQTLLADSSGLDGPIAPQIMPPGYDEGVIRDEYGQTMQ